MATPCNDRFVDVTVTMADGSELQLDRCILSDVVWDRTMGDRSVSFRVNGYPATALGVEPMSSACNLEIKEAPQTDPTYGAAALQMGKWYVVDRVGPQSSVFGLLTGAVVCLFSAFNTDGSYTPPQIAVIGGSRCYTMTALAGYTFRRFRSGSTLTYRD